MKKIKTTFVKSVEQVYTGGNIYNDLITLKDGIIIAIGEGTVTIYKNLKAWEDSEEFEIAYLPEGE